MVWSEENQEHWGEEENQDTAKKIAEEMNLELKVTGYVKTILGDTINRIYDDLLNLGIPHNIAKNALHDGHLALLHIIITIDNAKKNGQPQVVDPKESK